VTAAQMEPSAEAQRALTEADALVVNGRVRDAIDLLATANRACPDAALECRLVELRHAAVARPLPAPARPAPERQVIATDPFGGPGAPEVHARELTAGLLAAALRHRGCLLVRGFLDRGVASALLDHVKQAFAAAEAAASGAPLSKTAPWYVPFQAESDYSFGYWERAFAQRAGSVLSVDSPRTLSRIIDALHAVGVGELLNEYFGERPVLSAKKSTLRSASNASMTEWHQDGAFLGPGTQAVNTWVALTPCGSDAPGIDVFACPFDEIVGLGADDALFDWSVSADAATTMGTSSIVRPEFEPGDALLFDQLTLHRTAVEPTMTRERYAIESWFFTLSNYPYEQVPIFF